MCVVAEGTKKIEFEQIPECVPQPVDIIPFSSFVAKKNEQKIL